MKFAEAANNLTKLVQVGKHFTNFAKSEYLYEVRRICQ